MKFSTGVLALAAFAVLAGPASRAGAATITDQLCPEAAPFVNAMGQLSQTDPPQQIYDASHAANAAYRTCAKRHLSNGNVEPGVHYAYTREASFGIVEARALIALGRDADADAVLATSKRLAQDVFDWRRSMSMSGSNRPGDQNTKDTRPSIYRDAAKDVLDAANQMLAARKAAPAAASPVPKTSPAP